MNRRTLAFTSALALSIFGAGCAKKTVDDQALTTAIQSKLYGDAATRQAGINVSVKDGVVTLSGEVPNPDVAQEAVKLANGTDGVRSVDQQIKVNTAVAANTPANNAGSVPASNLNTPAPSPTPSPAYPAQPTPNPAPAVKTPPPSSPEATAPAERPREQRPMEPAMATIPAGTRLSVRTVDAIDSKQASEGSTYRASLDSPLISRGRVVVPAGSDVTLSVSSVQNAGRIKGNSALSLKATTLRYQGKAYNLATSDVSEEGKSRGKNTAVKTGIGAAAGALIGGLAGGGKGAGIGAAAGGGAGFGWNALTHGQQIKIPSETVLNFRLESPLTVPMSNRASE